MTTERTDNAGSSTSPSSPGARLNRGGRWSRLCLKELRETLRDRRTLITLILMPLLVYPVLSMVFQRSLVSAWSSSQRPKIVIGTESEQAAAILKTRLHQAELYMAAKQRRANIQRDAAADDNDDDVEEAIDDANQSVQSNARPAAPPLAGLPSLPGEQDMLLGELDVSSVEFRILADLRENVQAEIIDIGILDPLQEQDREFQPIQIIHRADSSLSERALGYVEERIEAFNEANLRQRLHEVGQSAELILHTQRDTIQVKSQDTTLSTIVPMILILMTVTGAVYPAIDLTAGERERGTLEMLMASPVPRLKLLLAKYVAVVTVAFLTALVNLTAMTITLSTTGLGKVLFGEAGLSLSRIAQILALLLLFAAFFSAVLLALTSFARSFKEAQAYLIPLMLLSLGPGIVSLMPGLKLGGLLAITPVSNMVLLARDLCSGGADPMMATVAVLSTALYTLAAIGIAAKIFGADAVMSGSSADLKSLFSASATGQRVSSVSGALLCLSVVFPIYFVTTNIMGQLVELPIAVRLVISGLATSVLFGVIPWIAARIQKLDLRQSFQLLRAPLPAFTVAVLLGLTVWPIAHEIVMFTQWLGWNSFDLEQIDGIAQFLDVLRTTSPWLVLLGMAVAPAVFEELFFRGYLFSALKSATDRRTTIVASAVLFGLFHVIAKDSLSIERLLPSTFMGLILGWLCYRSGSVLPGMILHACHNGLLVMMAYYKQELSDLGFGMEEQAHLPTSWLIMSLFSLLFGIVFIAFLPPATGRMRGAPDVQN